MNPRMAEKGPATIGFVAETTWCRQTADTIRGGVTAAHRKKKKDKTNKDRDSQLNGRRVGGAFKFTNAGRKWAATRSRETTPSLSSDHDYSPDI